uniref:Uncharacterized protein n=1 Tax=Caenorhabditis japonica TaxID=281687 RepID=A0A8R1EI87_CAEJA
MPRRRGSSSSSSAAGGSGGGFGLSSLRRELHLHNFFRTSSPSSSSSSRPAPPPPSALPPRSSATTNIPHKLTSPYHPSRELTVSTFSAGSATAADGLGGAHLTPSLSSSVHARRESFLYRASDDLREASSLRPVSRASSIASNEHGKGRPQWLCSFIHSFIHLTGLDWIVATSNSHQMSVLFRAQALHFSGVCQIAQTSSEASSSSSFISILSDVMCEKKTLNTNGGEGDVRGGQRVDVVDVDVVPSQKTKQ